MNCPLLILRVAFTTQVIHYICIHDLFDLHLKNVRSNSLRKKIIREGSIRLILFVLHRHASLNEIIYASMTWMYLQ
jgi:hypothetical protein